GSPRDLMGAHLLHAADPWEAGLLTDGWIRWLTAVGVHLQHSELRQGTQFNLSLLGVQAALDGQGIAMGRLALVQHYLLQGRLVVPFRFRGRARATYFFICNSSHPAMPTILDWLVEEASRFRQMRDAFFDSAEISFK